MRKYNHFLYQKKCFYYGIMKNIIILTGYYGSGKTEITVNLAIEKKVDMVIDLDIINPYFRTREKEKELSEYNIKTISSNMQQKINLDMPYISRKIFIPFHDKKIKAIYDLGGNDQGAKLLRQFEDYTDHEIELFLVVNIYRQETSNTDLILKLINKIEGMGGFKITGLINNSNFLKETTAKHILEGEKVLKEVSEKIGLPIVYTAIWDQIKLNENLTFSGKILKMKLYFRKNWL